MNYDIGHILEDWPYDYDEDIVVRIIDGNNGPKLQMRVDMGIIQLELDGNPTGEHPAGYESWFDFYHERQKQVELNQIDDFFTLNDEDSKKLRQEAVHYYYRYLCLMKLGDYRRVIRDTDRNYRLFAFLKKYASNETERWALDQYRPYVIMMSARAKASLALKENPKNGIVRALEFTENGIEKIVDFFQEYGITSEMENSIELSILKALKNEFLRSIPLSLEEQLLNAVKEERFEDAAVLRDQIRTKNRKN